MEQKEKYIPKRSELGRTLIYACFPTVKKCLHLQRKWLNIQRCKMKRTSISVRLTSQRTVSVLLFVIPFLIRIMLQTTEVRGTSALTAYMWLRTTTK
jgi:hypothetical protein